MAKRYPEVIAVVPARYGSTRFPGKPLTMIAGWPMIRHVVERASRARRVARVVVATDDDRVLRAVGDFGGQAILTRRDHRCGTERVAEVAAVVPAEVYVNVQGDEPLIDPGAIDTAVEALAADNAAQIATLCAPIAAPAEIMDPNVVKVVCDFEDGALYFSRAPVPWVREAEQLGAARHFKHLGLYAYRRAALLDFPTLPPGELERLEQLEQLRWLENGYRIRVVECAYGSVAVDVPDDVARVEKMLKDSPLR